MYTVLGLTIGAPSKCFDPYEVTRGGEVQRFKILYYKSKQTQEKQRVSHKILERT